jgi:hypothetical protein
MVLPDKVSICHVSNDDSHRRSTMSLTNLGPKGFANVALHLIFTELMVVKHACRTKQFNTILFYR